MSVPTSPACLPASIIEKFHFSELSEERGVFSFIAPYQSTHLYVNKKKRELNLSYQKNEHQKPKQNPSQKLKITDSSSSVHSPLSVSSPPPHLPVQGPPPPPNPDSGPQLSSPCSIARAQEEA
jgi:hypothetical protein